MLPLHCDIQISWKTQLASSLFYVVLIAIILFFPWPQDDWYLWLTLAGLLCVEGIFCQKRIASSKGELVLLSSDTLYWDEQRWHILRSPFYTSQGILFSLESQQTGKKRYLWIAEDSMTDVEWRELCGVLTMVSV